MASEYRATYAYTAKGARHVYAAMLWRRFDGLIIATPILFVWAWLNVGSGYAALAGFGLGAIIMFWLFLLVGLRRAGGVARGAGRLEVSLVFNEEGFTSQTADVMAVSKWAGVSGIFKTRKFLVFIRKASGYATFVPTASLPPGAGDFIADRVRKGGGRVW